MVSALDSSLPDGAVVRRVLELFLDHPECPFSVHAITSLGARYGVRVNCVAPGPVLTRPGMAGMKTPLGRAADPQEIVDMVLYLASERSAFVTGSMFLMDGGRHLMMND